MTSGWIRAGVLCLSLAASSAAFAADTVKVGLINTTSGPYAVWGTQFKYGIEAFQKEHGTSVNGTEIQVLSRDVGGNDPVKSKQLAQDLILKDKANFLAGFEFSPTAYAIADLITQAKVPAIILNAATADIVRKSPYFVRISYTIPLTALPVANWAAKNGIKRVVTAVSDYAPGYDAEEYFNTPFKKQGGTILDDIRIPLSTTDFSPVYEKILGEKPDALYIFGPGGPGGIAMVNTWASRLLPASIKLLCAGCVDQLTLPGFGKSAIGVVGANYYEAGLDNKLNAQMKADITAKFGADAIPNAATVNSYDLMQMVYSAVAKFGPKITGDQAMSFFKTLKQDSPRGTLEIDPNTRDVVENVYMTRVVEKDGKPVNSVFETIPRQHDPWKDDHPSN